jgi:hypothetical protein
LNLPFCFSNVDIQMYFCFIDHKQKRGDRWTLPFCQYVDGPYFVYCVRLCHGDFCKSDYSYKIMHVKFGFLLTDFVYIDVVAVFTKSNLHFYR